MPVLGATHIRAPAPRQQRTRAGLAPPPRQLEEEAAEDVIEEQPIPQHQTRLSTSATQIFDLHADPSLGKAWHRYVRDPRGLADYQVAERLISAGAPDGVIYSYLQSHPNAKRGPQVSQFVTRVNAQLERLPDMTSRQQFDLLVDHGFIPKGSKFYDAVTADDIRAIQAASVERAGVLTDREMAMIQDMKPQDWAYATPKQQTAVKGAVQERYQELKSALASRKAQRAVQPYISGDTINLVKLYDENKKAEGDAILRDYGYSQSEINKWYRATREYKAFLGTHVAPGAGDMWLTKKDYDNLSPQYQRMYDRAGWEGIERLSGVHETLLSPYSIPMKGTGDVQSSLRSKGEGISYDIAHYLRDHDDNDTVLKAYGFSKESIEAAREYNKANPWVYETPEEKFINALNQYKHPDPLKDPAGYKLFLQKHPDVDKLRREYLASLKEPVSSAPISMSQWTSNFIAARDDGQTTITREKRRELVALAQAEYARRYGWGTATASAATSVGAALFAPARVAYPEVTFRDIKGTEWVVGGAQVVLLASPVIGGAVGRAAGTTAGAWTGRGLQLAASGAFLGTTIKDWGNMSPAERYISLGIDTLIIGVSLRGVLPKGTLSRAAKRTISGTAAAISKQSENLVNAIKKLRLTKRQSQMMGEIKGQRMLTEGGIVGPWGRASDEALVNAVANGRKPVALVGVDKIGGQVVGENGALLAKQRGLVVKHISTARLNNGDIIHVYVGNGKYVRQVVKAPASYTGYLVFQDTAAGRLAYNRVRRAWVRQDAAVAAGDTEAILAADIELGKGFGYRPEDIRAFLEHSAKLNVAIDKNFALRNALNNVAVAIMTQDKPLMLRAARQLQMIGTRIPKQLGGGTIKRYGQLIEANADDYLKLATKTPADDVLKAAEEGVKANEQFIKNAERQLRRTKNPDTKRKIEEALREAQKVQERKKVIVITREKMPAQATPEFPAGKFLPARVKPSAKPAPKVTPAIFAGRTKKDVADLLGITVTELEAEIAKFSPSDRKKVSDLLRTSGKTGQKAKDSTIIRPSFTPSVSNVEDTSWQPAILPQPQPAPAREVVTVEKTDVKEGEKTEPIPAPYPSTSTPTDTTTKASVKRGRPPFPSIKARLESMTAAERKGVVAWKQGFIYIVWFPPYTKRDIYYSVKRPQGVTVVKDRETAYKTIQTISGRPPSKAVMRMGFQQVTVTAPPREPGRRGAIAFEPIPQYTSKKRGKIYHTNVGGEKVLSRRPVGVKR